MAPWHLGGNPNDSHVWFLWGLHDNRLESSKQDPGALPSMKTEGDVEATVLDGVEV